MKAEFASNGMPFVPDFCGVIIPLIKVKEGTAKLEDSIITVPSAHLGITHKDFKSSILNLYFGGWKWCFWKVRHLWVGKSSERESTFIVFNASGLTRY